MLKRKIIILIGLAVLVILIIFGIAFISQPKKTQNGGETGTNFFSNLFPFINRSENSNNSFLNLLGITEDKDEVEFDSLLKKVSSFPVSGYIVFNQERFINVPEVSPALPTSELNQEKELVPPLTEFIPTVRYVQKSNGNIYQTYLDEINERVLSFNITPFIHEAFFGKNGESVVMRYLKNNNIIESFIQPLPKETLGGDISENQSSGAFLPQDITQLTFSPDKSQLFFLANVQNNAVGIVGDLIGENKKQVFLSPFTEWLPQWPNDRMITLNTKPAYGIPGYLYAIDPLKKDLVKIIGNINGLTSLTSPNGKLVLYNNDNLSLYLYDRGTNNSKYLGLNSLAEKCVWSKTNETIYCAIPVSIPSGQYPDSWYQKEVSFEDEIWKIDLTNGNNLKILETEENMDIIHLSLDENEKYLLFLNKKDPYLWALIL